MTAAAAAAAAAAATTTTTTTPAQQRREKTRAQVNQVSVFDATSKKMDGAHVHGRPVFVVTAQMYRVVFVRVVHHSES